MAEPFRAALRTVCLLLTLSSIATSARGDYSNSCSPLPEPTLVNQFLSTNRSDLRNPAFRESVSLLDAQLGFRFPRQLQVVKCHSLRNHSFDFYQVESPSQKCKAPPPLDFDVSPTVGSKLKGPGGLLFYTFLISLVVSGFTTWFLVLWIPELVIEKFGPLAICWLLGKLSFSPPQAEASGYDVEQGQFRAAFEQNINGEWTQVDKPAHERPTSGGSVALRETGSDLHYLERPSLSLPTPQAGLGGPLPQTSALQKGCDFLKGIAWCCYGIAFYATLISLVGFIVVAMMCQTSVNEIALKGPIRLPEPAGALNEFLEESGLRNLTLCTTETMSFYVSCPIDSCHDLGEPYGERAPAKEPLRVCPDYFGRSSVKMDLIQNVSFGGAAAVAASLFF